MPLIKFILNVGIDLILAPWLVGWALVGRFLPKTIDIGLGPEPLINNCYHKKSLIPYGYSAETFVSQVFYITDGFDVRGDLWMTWLGKWMPNGLTFIAINLLMVLRVLHRYRVLYLYFNGGPLGMIGSTLNNSFLLQLEPWLYHLAKVRVVVMPYGSDVQDMTRSPNLLFKHTISHDYPKHRFRRTEIASRIDLWTRHADHIISGCEWVDYMFHWDTLMLAHFSIDTDQWKPQKAVIDLPISADAPLRIFHAPNHRSIKGTQYLCSAVDSLRNEGVPIELVIVEKVANAEIRRVMETVDVVADQWVVGWYAMFALEAMSLEKPVLCFLREDLENLYINAGLVEKGEIPIIRCDPLSLESKLRELVKMSRADLHAIGRLSRAFVLRHHSTASIGAVFDKINKSLGIIPAKAIGGEL